MKDRYQQRSSNRTKKSIMRWQREIANICMSCSAADFYVPSTVWNRDDRSTWSTSSLSVFLVPPRRSLPLVIGSCSTESLVIVPVARSVLPSFLRARPPASLHGVPLTSRGLRRCINRTFSTVTPAPWSRKREHLTTKVCRCREQMVGTRIPLAPRSKPRRLKSRRASMHRGVG